MRSRSAAAVHYSAMCTSLRAPGTLETERLVLRRPGAVDAPAVFARYAGDSAVTRYLGWRTHVSVSETQIFLASCDTEWRRSRCRMPPRRVPNGCSC